MENYQPNNTLLSTLYSGFDLPESTDISTWRESIMARELNTASVVNLKTNGVNSLQEIPNGELWFAVGNNNTLRNAFRKVLNFGALPNSSTKSVPHGISVDSNFSLTKLLAAASDQIGFNYIPIPYASLSSPVEINMDVTNVNITTNSNRTNFTICYVVIEYLKF